MEEKISISDKINILRDQFISARHDRRHFGLIRLRLVSGVFAATVAISTLVSQHGDAPILAATLFIIGTSVSFTLNHIYAKEATIFKLMANKISDDIAKHAGGNHIYEIKGYKHVYDEAKKDIKFSEYYEKTTLILVIFAASVLMVYFFVYFHPEVSLNKIHECLYHFQSHS